MAVRRHSMLAGLLLLLLCGTGRGGHPSLNLDGMVAHLQRSAADSAAFYLPVAVSPTSPCGRALATMATELLVNNSMWAAIMVDSWGKSTDGALVGNKYNGVYDECLTVASPDNLIKGKYCKIHTYNLIPNKEVTSLDQQLPLGHRPGKLDFSLLRELAKESQSRMALSVPPPDIEYGTCIPNVCSGMELQNSLIQSIAPSGINPVVFQCGEQETELEFTDADVGFISLITFLLVLIVCASLVDIYIHFSGLDHLTKGVLRYLLVFSAYTNLSKMLQVNPKPSPGNISCLHAMRTLSMTWVIWCHQQTIAFPNTANIFVQILRYDGILAQIILNGYPSVDTFFFLSGLLLSYSVLKQTKKTKSFNILLYYLHRIIRLIPAMGIMCGFVATVMRFFVAGPFAYIWNYYWQPMCAHNWWKDIGFINNLNTETGTCLGQTWYIAADMQMYLVAPIIILPVYFFKKCGEIWLFLVTAVSAIIPAAIIYVNNLPPTSLIGDANVEAYFDLIYAPPWTRASPWIAGMWVGYIFFRQGNTRYKMNPLVVMVGWTLASITGLLVVFGMYNYNLLTSQFPYEMMTSVTYGGGHRLAWGAALGWVVFACHNGYGGVVDGFLSHPVWQPVSRLTYTTYLVAFPVQFLLFYNTRGGVFYFTHVNLLIVTVGGTVLCIFGAILLSLMAESPIVGLEKLLLRPNHDSSPRKPVGGENGEPQAPSNGFPNPVFTVEDGAVRGVDEPMKESDAASKIVTIL